MYICIYLYIFILCSMEIARQSLYRPECVKVNGKPWTTTKNLIGTGQVA